MEITNKIRRLAATTLTLYLLLLVWIIALKCNMKDAILDAKIFNRDFSLGERFVFQLSQFSKAPLDDGILNILFFVPLGILLPFFINKHPYLKTVLIGFFISTGFEILQILNCIGRFTYVDIINNTFGVILGMLVYLGLRRRIKEKTLAATFVVFISILTPILIAAAVNTILHIEYYL